MHIFDDLDHQLISILREDGRAPVSQIADQLKVTRATVQKRMDRLLESGAILGYTVRVREDYGGAAVRAIMMIEISGRSTTDTIKSLRGLSELYQLHTTNGSWDLIAEIRAKNLHDFDRVLREVRMTQGVSNTETSILLSST